MNKEMKKRMIKMAINVVVSCVPFFNFVCGADNK